MPSAEFWSIAEQVKKFQRKKFCLAASAGGCGGSIVKAHTIPRSQLAQIAIDGHVYSFEATVEDIAKTSGKFPIGKFGINDFSVLTCFCAAHDKSLFSPIEDKPLEFSLQQISLLHYRAMGLEYYKKLAGLKVAEFAAEKVRRRKFDIPERRRFMESHLLGTGLGVRDIRATFKQCEEGIYKSNYTKFSGLVVLFKTMPTIMTVGGFAPEFAYDGSHLERLGNLVGPGVNHLSFSILATEGRAAVVFAWLKDAVSGKRFGDSYISQRPDLFCTLAIQTAFEHIENTCVNPLWWDGLRAVERNLLLRRMHTAANLLVARKSSALRYCGVTFADWQYSEHRFVNC